MEHKEETPDAEKVLEELKRKSKPEKNKQNRQLRNILVGIGIFVLVIIGILVYLGSQNTFEYRGVKFERIQEAGINFYRTEVPLYDDAGNYYNYFNIFLRKDPRTLEKVEIEGDFIYRKLAVIEIKNESGIQCQGDGVIAMANLVQLYGVVRGKMLKDENATCDVTGRYSYFSLKAGNETKIKQEIPFCYEVIVNNCEILEATERIMLEILVKYNNEVIEKNLSIGGD